MGKMLGLGSIEALPIEIKWKIIERVSGTDAAKLECVNQEWRRMIPSPNDSFWKKMCFADRDWTEMWKQWWYSMDLMGKITTDVGLLERFFKREIRIGDDWWNNMCMELREARNNSDWDEIPKGWNWKDLFGLWIEVRGDVSQYLYFLQCRTSSLERFSTLIDIIRAGR